MSGRQPETLMVRDRSALGRIAAALRREAAIGVDLEADSMFHYREKVCLIQVSTRSQDILVDPLALEDLSPLSPVLADPNIRKVFHGADYDMRSLYRDFGMEVNSLFDTQIAARFLGSRETGLAFLLKERLGVVLDKKYQKKDWSQRPLPAPMLTYAAHDTHHLLALGRMLEKELRVKGRLSWVEEECEILSRVRPSPPADSPFYLRFKGAGRLDPRGLAVLESILKWRDQKARGRDLPPFKVLGNEPILEIAQTKPVTESELSRIRGLSADQIRLLGRSILNRILESMALPESDLPRYPRRQEQQMSAGLRKRVWALKEWRERRAQDMGVDTSLVCTNPQIQSLALASPERPEDLARIDGLRAWQRRLFGPEICSVLGQC